MHVTRVSYSGVTLRATNNHRLQCGEHGVRWQIVETKRPIFKTRHTTERALASAAPPQPFSISTFASAPDEVEPEAKQ